MSWDKATSNREITKPVELDVIELRLPEGVRQVVGQSVEHSIE